MESILQSATIKMTIIDRYIEMEGYMDYYTVN